MREFQYEGPEGCFTYIKQGHGIEITGYQGLAGHVDIPGRLPCETESFEVTGISKKVFLSKKYLRSIVVPASVESVGDWAFAYCDALREVSFKGRKLQFGKDVFKECGGLRCVRFLPRGDAFVAKADECKLDEESSAAGNCVQQDSFNCDGVGALMAAAVTQMESSYLLDAGESGSREWLEKWDARMLVILKGADDDGYSKQILCGEEDYESADLETYLRNSRRKKVRLLLLRLLYPMGLAAGLEMELKTYLLEHTKGCRTDETWQVIRDEYGDRREFYELFARLGCLTKENAPQVISETREENPEMKAYFLKYQADHFTENDFFGKLLL